MTNWIERRLSELVYATVDKFADRGLAARVLRDEHRREQTTAAASLEAQYRYCGVCGRLVGDAANDAPAKHCGRRVPA